MVCLVLSSFAVPLRASSQTLMKGGHQLEPALGRLSSKAAVSTAQKVLGSCSSNKHILSMNRRCQHCFVSCTRFLSEASCYNLVVDYHTEIVISGYCVGPDADDGWGFVEAVIKQMT